MAMFTNLPTDRDGEYFGIGVDFWEEGASCPYDGWTVVYFDDEAEADEAMSAYCTPTGVARLLDLLGETVDVGEEVQVIYEFWHVEDGGVYDERSDWREYFRKNQDGTFS